MSKVKVSPAVLNFRDQFNEERHQSIEECWGRLRGKFLDFVAYTHFYVKPKHLRRSDYCMYWLIYGKLFHQESLPFIKQEIENGLVRKDITPPYSFKNIAVEIGEIAKKFQSIDYTFEQLYLEPVREHQELIRNVEPPKKRNFIEANINYDKPLKLEEIVFESSKKYHCPYDKCNLNSYDPSGFISHFHNNHVDYLKYDWLLYQGVYVVILNGGRKYNSYEDVYNAAIETINLLESEKYNQKLESIQEDVKKQSNSDEDIYKSFKRIAGSYGSAFK